MQIELAENAGFCFGVKRAIDIVRNAADEKKNVKTLGPLIHNPQVVDWLKDIGVGVANDLSEMDGDTVVIRCHGVPPSVLEESQSKGFSIIDATCPYVKRSMELARGLKNDGYDVVIVGEPDHPEVVAVRGATGNTAFVAESASDLEGFSHRKRVGVVAQTTQSLSNFQECVAALLEDALEVKAYNTICNATSQRQTAARKLAEKADVMLVVGGRNSANTSRLAEICSQVCARTYHIETREEIDPSWFKAEDFVGITAGASTPAWLIEGVIERMKELDEKLNQNQESPVERLSAEQDESPDPKPEEPGAPIESGIDGSREAGAAAEGESEEVREPEATATPSEAPKMVEYEDSFVTLSPGQIVKGRVVQVGQDEVMVDIGYKSEGVIPSRELGLRGGQTPAEAFKPGDEISVYVLRVEDTEGNVILSKKRADFENAWNKLEEAYNSQIPVTGRIKERVKGGLLVDVGVRGFIPASHVARNYVENLESFVGQEVKLKVIELDKQKNNVVLSRKDILEEEYEKAKQEAFETLKENSIVRGVVKRITDFGAFVDIGGGVEGLLHVSEMAWSRVRHPSDVVSEGQTINVMVLNIDKEGERISLGLKQTMADPWESVDAKYYVGQLVDGEVTRVVDFGAFVKLEDGIEGLVHISQMSEERIGHPSEVVSPGQKVTTKIVSIDKKARRIGLSIREALRELRPEETAAPKQEKAGTSGSIDAITLGDVFENLGSLLEERRKEESDETEVEAVELSETASATEDANEDD